MANPAVWFRLNDGEWNGSPSADPATLTGGFDISSFIGPYLPFMSGSTGFGGNLTLTLNAGASSFSYTAPSGSTPLGASITWNPSDKSAAMILSDGNLEAGVGSENGGWIRATGGASAGGLQYFEETTGPGFNAEDSFVGVANSGANISQGGSPGAGAGTISYTASGQIVIGATDVLASGLAEASPGDVVGIAIYTVPVPTPTPTPTPTPPTPPVVIPQSLGLWRGQVGINWQGLALVGDAFTNVVGLSDFTIYTEYGNRMQFLATTPPVQHDRKRISIPRFEIEVEAGQGTPGSPQVAPLMILDYSKDGGITWSQTQVFRSMGAVGEYIKRLRWINLGNSRTWVFRIQYSGTARPAIIGTYYDSFVNLG
jgi:hypothetical protein